MKDGHFAVSISLLGCLLMFASGYTFAMVQKAEDRECSTTLHDQFGHDVVMVGKC